MSAGPESQAEGDRTRVLIVDDQALLREGLSSLLALDETIEVVGTAANGLLALEMVRRTCPDVVLMDIRMPEMDGIAATRALKQDNPHINVVVLTTFDDDELIVKALHAGASGYVLKDTPSEQLARDVRAVHGGASILSPDVARKVVAQLVAYNQDSGNSLLPQHGSDDLLPAPPPGQRIDDAGRESLSEREIAVLRLAAQGLSNREIGLRLYITEGTVKNHISSLLSKLHLRDRTQAVLYAKECRII